MAALSYILCATPRSGSTLLCDLLADTGIAGKPASYYRRQSIPRWIERLGVPGTEGADFERAYLDAILKAGSGDGDIFGMRLMWETLPELQAHLSPLYSAQVHDRDRLEAAFGSIVYVHLSRQDKIGQAISQLKAEQSGLWHMAADGSERERIAPPRQPEYDADRIAELSEQNRADDDAWGDWFAAQDLQPLTIHYEALSADPRATIAKVLEALDLDPAQADAVEVKTRKLADDESQDWAARFRVERGLR